MRYQRVHINQGQKPIKQFNVDAGLMKPLSLIVAVDEHGGFGKDGKIPWHHSEDLKHFQKTTKGAACIMGRKTYHDMYDMVLARKGGSKKKEKKKPVVIKEILPGRECYVVTNSMTDVEGATAVKSIREAVEQTKKRKIFVIGGEKMYIESLPWVNTIYMTVVKGTYECDRFFPVDYVHKNYRIVRGEAGSDSLLFVEYARK